ncbi:unnamed protein product [Acanthoscelides obtectus]|uniref:CCHC-type domain-containing protein n=1 Tax=Acanthoscelides obtectus TaxID=200917 RepID=A0A9P0M637_ACAOB|nr:unnamed protein product [Acanthoscelides obtectus]CAK1663853.1 hypothetical protein AOBTE_LOCUS23898 [Acanthoscelides obtectus]
MGNAKLEQELKSKFRPSQLNANVIGTRLIRDGVLVNCADVKSLQNLKDGLKRQAGNAFNVYESKKLRPKIVVYSVDKSAAEDARLSEIIIADNELDATEADIRVVTNFKFKDGINVVLEVTPSIFKNVMGKGFLYIGWKRCNVKEHFNVAKCFKCYNYGHYKKDCKSSATICPQYSGNHEKRDCISSDLCCINYKTSNNKFKTNFPTDHSANSTQCLCYLNKLGQLKDRIQYEQ